MTPSIRPTSARSLLRSSVAMTLLVSVAAFAASSLAVKAFNKSLGRGVNLGNELEAPSEGSWGPRFDSSDLPTIAANGFSSVRAPIRWDGIGADTSITFDRASRTPPYSIDPRFLARVDSLVSWSRRNHLLLILNDHHHEALFDTYEQELPRFLAIWKQVAERYKDLPTDSVAFEILNEPIGQIKASRWNWLLDTTLRIIRTSNPRRPVLIGTADWGGTISLEALRLPADSNLILTIHDYEPKSFVQQGTGDLLKGVKWGAYWDIQNAISSANLISSYSKLHDIPVNIGEFGTTTVSDSVSRDRWASVKSRLYENRGFSWTYWDFKERTMGLYSSTTKKWNSELLGALFSTDTSLLGSGTPLKPDSDLVLNGLFKGDTGWYLTTMDSGKGTLHIDSGVAVMTVDENPNEIGWAVALCQNGILLRKGFRYLISFRAWSDSATSIDTWVGHGEDPWPGYSWTEAQPLTSVPQRFNFHFQIPTKAQDDSLGEFCFELGLRKTRIHIDSVQFLSFSPPPTSVAPRSIGPRSIRLEGRQLVSKTLPGSRWLVDVRGVKICPLNWRPSSKGWTADLRSAPNNRLLFPDQLAMPILLGSR